MLECILWWFPIEYSFNNYRRVNDFKLMSHAATMCHPEQDYNENFSKPFKKEKCICLIYESLRSLLECWNIIWADFYCTQLFMRIVRTFWANLLWKLFHQIRTSWWWFYKIFLSPTWLLQAPIPWQHKSKRQQACRGRLTQPQCFTVPLCCSVSYWVNGRLMWEHVKSVACVSLTLNVWESAALVVNSHSQR